MPVDVLRTMPMPALRARVEAFRKAPRAFAATPPAQGATGIAALSDEDRDHLAAYLVELGRNAV